MRKHIHFIYHAIEVLLFKIKSNIIRNCFKAKLYINNVETGKGIRAMNKIPLLHIHHKCKKCKIGNNVLFRSNTGNCWNSPTDIIVKKDATLIIGNNTGIIGSLIYCTNNIEIGNNVMIGGGCRIFDTNFHPIEAELRRNPATCNNGVSAPVIIDDDVFIGTNCIIGKGIHIGKGAVVAAGSVVAKNIPENEIWGGNPAKFLKKIEQ